MTSTCCCWIGVGDSGLLRASELSERIDGNLRILVEGGESRVLMSMVDDESFKLSVTVFLSGPTKHFASSWSIFTHA